MNLKQSLFSLAFVIAAAGCNNVDHGTMGGHKYKEPTAAQIAAAKDMHNTVCPVSGDKIGDTKIVAIHDGKLYHICCAGCAESFNENPDQYIKELDANPAKYGLKQ
jgi:YHS domain-containing protein